MTFQVLTNNVVNFQGTWDFGDSTISTEKNPTYIYNSPGLYTPTLTMVTGAGNTVTKSLTINVEPFCHNTTDGFVYAWGDVFVDGKGLGIGDWIGAFVDDVVVNGGCVGRWMITEDGIYGAMPIYGDDQTYSGKNGALQGDRIRFKAFLINEGRIVNLTPTGPDEPIWGYNYQTLHINLNNSQKQEIYLHQGWNLISFQINKCYYQGAIPPTFIPEEIDKEQIASIKDWLSNDTISPLRDMEDSNQAGKWQRITSFDAKGAHILDKNLPAQVNTLTYLSVGYGYWIKMNEPGFLIFQGQFAQTNTPLTLHSGWNLIGYIPYNICYADIPLNSLCPYVQEIYKPEENIVFCPLNELLIPSVFVSLNNKFRRITTFDTCKGAMIFDTTLPPIINTLHYLGPKYGYWIKMEDPNVNQLIFPKGCPEN